MQAIAVTILVVLLSACATTTGRKIDTASASKIQIGKTTKEEVIQLLGSPDSYSRVGAEETFTYSYSRSAPRAINFVPVVGDVASGSDELSQAVVVSFGANGVVSYVSVFDSLTEQGYGLDAGSQPNRRGVQAAPRPK